MRAKGLACGLAIVMVCILSAGAATENPNVTFFGDGAGFLNTGLFVTFIGSSAGGSANSGTDNTFVGDGAGLSNTIGEENTFIGSAAGGANTQGNFNTFMGAFTGSANTTGSDNTFIGDEAGNSCIDGKENTFVGSLAGFSNVDGNGNVFLGFNAGSAETGSNKLFIDNCFVNFPICDQPLIYGEFDNRIVAIDGSLGIGTGTRPPNGMLEVLNTQDAITTARVENDDIFGAFAASAQEQFVLGPPGSEHLILQVLSDSHPSLPRVALLNAFTHDFYIRTNAVNVVKVIRTGAVANTLVLNTGKVGIGTSTPAHLIQLSGGAFSDGTVWTDASSREYKENIKELTTEEAMKTLAGLNPVKYNYKTDKDDKHVGFIAEDVPDLVSTKDRKGLSPLDIVAVLTKAFQEQRTTIEVLMEKVSKLEAEVNRLKSKGMTAKAMNQD